MFDEKMVKFDDEVKNSLIKGVDLIANAVQTTYGPDGRNVIIKNRGGIHITKDGATVAEYVNSDDPLIQMGIDTVKEVSLKTAKDVGDGTSTAIILARAIINNCKNFKENPIVIQRGLQKECSQVINILKEIKKDITEERDIRSISILSANNDEKLGNLIADAYIRVGKEGIVQMEQSSDVEDYVVYSEGFEIESGYMSPYFINTDNNTCELKNVLVHISEYEIEETKDIIDVAEEAMKTKKQLLIIAPKINTNVLRFFIVNKSKLESCCITSPGFKHFRDINLQDIRNMLGETMTCEKVIIDKELTTFSGCNPNKELVEKEIESIKSKLNSNSLDEVETKFHLKRLANYTGGVATIYVGGYSQVEITEKKDRVDDAICAVKAALQEGVLPGGGSALWYCANKLDLKYLGKVLPLPLCILSQMSNYIGDFPNNLWSGIDFKNHKIGDMLELGIIDPFLVTKTALENAVSVASLILTNECSIINMD